MGLIIGFTTGDTKSNYELNQSYSRGYIDGLRTVKVIALNPGESVNMFGANISAPPLPIKENLIWLGITPNSSFDNIIQVSREDVCLDNVTFFNKGPDMFTGTAYYIKNQTVAGYAGGMASSSKDFKQCNFDFDNQNKTITTVTFTEGAKKITMDYGYFTDCISKGNTTFLYDDTRNITVCTNINHPFK